MIHIFEEPLHALFYIDKSMSYLVAEYVCVCLTSKRALLQLTLVEHVLASALEASSNFSLHLSL